MSTPEALSPTLARALVRSLMRGTAVAEGARFINVGQDNWLAAQREMLGEVAEDGHSETKFVRGAYGAGKSHFLSVVQDYGRDANWATSHVECKVDRVEIDRFETLYPRIASKIQTSDLLTVRARSQTGGEVDAIRFLLERWTAGILLKVGVREDGLTRPFDAEHRLYGQFQRGLLRSTHAPSFVQALMAFARATLSKDYDSLTAISAWLRGGNELLRIPTKYLQNPNASADPKAPVTAIRPIGAGTARDAMTGLLWLIRDAGYAGLILCIDEIEELARLRTQTRQDQALQALREFVDHGGGEGGFRHLCMYLAATPEMFDNDRYFPRYDALATRIQPLSDSINWRGPVIDLEKTPLNEQQLRAMGDRIVRVYRLAYGDQGENFSPDKSIGSLVEAVMTTRYRLAKPRLLARLLVSELERARAEKSDYRLPDDLKSLVSGAAASVAAEQATP